MVVVDFFKSQNTIDYDSLTYFRLIRTDRQHWAVFRCEVQGLYQVTDRDDIREDKLASMARAAFAPVLKARKPVPGEQCMPAKEIRKGSHTY